MRIKKLAFTVFLLFAMSMALNACGSRLPSRGDIVKANSDLLESPIQIGITLYRSTGGTQLEYNSQVLLEGSTAIWDGMAAIRYAGADFYQPCKSLCTKEGSYKLWRGDIWLASDTVSPVGLLRTWLQAIHDGMGYINREPVIPAENIPAYESITEPMYCIEVTHLNPELQAVCDVVPDSLFGGEDLLGGYEEWAVHLYFDARELTLTAATIIAGPAGDWMNVYLVIQPAEKAPQVDLSQIEIGQGYLAEEWTMENPEQ